MSKNASHSASEKKKLQAEKKMVKSKNDASKKPSVQKDAKPKAAARQPVAGGSANKKKTAPSALTPKVSVQSSKTKPTDTSKEKLSEAAKKTAKAEVEAAKKDATVKDSAPPAPGPRGRPRKYPLPATSARSAVVTSPSKDGKAVAAPQPDKKEASNVGVPLPIAAGKEGTSTSSGPAPQRPKLGRPSKADLAARQLAQAAKTTSATQPAAQTAVDSGAVIASFDSAHRSLSAEEELDKVRMGAPSPDSALEMVKLFYSEFPELTAARPSSKMPLGITGDSEGHLSLESPGKLSNEAALAKMMATVEATGIGIRFDCLLQQSPRAFEDTDPALRKLLMAQSGSRSVDMLDKELYRSVVERFVGSSRERIDRTKITPNNKVYIAQWTNRVAIWRFFHHYVSPVIRSHIDEVRDDLKYNAQAFEQLGQAKPGEISLINPFSHYEHAFPVVLNAWMPIINKVTKLFERNTRGGSNLREDFLSIANSAFLHALEKQAMAILGNSKQAQGIPFPKRLVYAIKKAIYTELPDITGAVRVPMENEARKNMPQVVSLDSWNDDDF